MIKPSQLFRLLYINRILVKHGLDEVVLEMHLFRPFRFLLYLLPWNWFGRRHVRVPHPVRMRRTLEDLGPIFVKLGQILSTRKDLLPDEIADELAKLQDNVPPFLGSEARRIIEAAYGQPLNKVFLSFDETPLASASIAQVHVATLLDGTEVIVKVVRPGIKKTIKRDLGLLYIMAEMVERYWSEGRRLRPLEVVAEYEKTIYDELDLMKEAASASQLRRNFEGSDLLYVPEIYWPQTRRNVMVMERIFGTPISDIDELRRQGVDLKKLSETGVEIFFTQVFKHNFFHADMHPGNIFVSAEGQYIAIDFGIMGTLSPDDQHYLAENFLAFFNRDYRRVAELHVQSEWVPKGTRVDEFESAIRSVCEPIFERPLKDISFGRLLLRLFQTARRFNMEVQPQLVLLQKTLLNIEGLGRQLYPELDLWQTAKPFLERWMDENIGGRAFVSSMKRNVPLWLDRLPEMPVLLHDVLQQARDGELKVEWQSKELRKIERTLLDSNRRLYAAIVGSALIVSAAILSGSGSASMVSWILAGIGIIVLLFSWPRDERRN
ncbi:MAG: ubiquinone biosynthesis regulatory protein kinase UbiB [Gammaproteobacteria bacterium]|nr:ubiquinone biosynthesis regulatory protein kinase UbiB [Gammaproteobacteria bacterium]